MWLLLSRSMVYLLNISLALLLAIPCLVVVGKAGKASFVSFSAPSLLPDTYIPLSDPLVEQVLIVIFVVMHIAINSLRVTGEDLSRC